jgi:hypothetical protein
LIANPAYSGTRRALLIGIQSYSPPAGASLPTAQAGHAPDSRFADGVAWPVLHGSLVDVANMRVLLEANFGFQDIRLITEQQATRQGILAAIDRLAADTNDGDLDVIYYAGHGSRRVDTLSSKNHMDETIVPIDAWKGAEDIRDKELALRFDRIVYEKHAHLTAIFDSCNSGTMARGITASVVRALPYDDRDVAEEKRRDPATVVETDLKRLPQDGDAIVLAAAASTESAAEALYSDDHQWHGAFSRALVRVLRSATQTLSAADVVAEVANMLHADPTPFQQPSVEGRLQQSLFGGPVPTHALHAHAVKAPGSAIALDIGSAGGFDTGSQFTAVEAGAGGERTVLEVAQITGPLESRAHVVSGPGAVQPGQLFELTRMTYPHAARLTIFASQASNPSEALNSAKARYPALSWVDDPAVDVIDFLVVNSGGGWTAYGRDGHAIAPGPVSKGAAFLLLGPPAALRTVIERTVPFQRNAFTFTSQLADANYLLAMRQKPGGRAEYAFIDPIVLAPHKAGAWAASAEDDADDAGLNGGQAPEVVCRNDVSLPVRTGWLPDSDSLDLALNRRIVRLGKLRVWLQAPGISPGAAGWPYHLEITPPGGDRPIAGLLQFHQQYQVRLVTTAGEIAANTPIPKYVYLFGFDCAANPYLLYPKESSNGEATLPQPGANGAYNLSVALGVPLSVETPVGADTLFLMVTAQKLTDPGILVRDGVLDRGTRGTVSRFEELIGDMNDAGTRGPREVPANWLIQQLLIPSRK